MAGFAVIDLETTGFAYNHTDRVCEIGVVLVDPDGRRERAWSTLVNPQRDLGAQHIHGIDASEARLAPTFAQVAGDLTDLLRGRVVTAHNSAFDTAFLSAEYARTGWPIQLTAASTLCTMRLAGEYLPGVGAKLAACCAHLGIPLTGAHCALDDAEATAQLLAHYVGASGGRGAWDQWFAFADGVAWPSVPRLGTSPVTRGAVTQGADALRAMVGGFAADARGVVGGELYLDLVDRVLLDRKISVDERRALAGMAESLGLTARDTATINRAYMLGVVEEVSADDRFTPGERALVIQLAGLLDLADLEVAGLLAEAEARVSVTGGGLELKPGDLVVLTGMSEARKRELTAVAQARGLVVWPGVKKGVAAVIAQDPGSDSGKARKAREYGIPVVGDGVLV